MDAPAGGAGAAMERMKTSMKARTKRKIAAVIGGFLLILMYGIVGGMDCGTIPFWRGWVEAMVCTLAAWVCFSKAGMVRHG